jgi:prophage antirepressor-like protein
MKKETSTKQGTPQQPATGVVTIPTFTVNGRNIVMTYANGRWWIAVRPICEILNVDYHGQYRTLKEGDDVGDVLYLATTRDTINREQKMVCISERFVYGWLFSIKSPSKDLKEYRRLCHDVLFNYFRGSFTER